MVQSGGGRRDTEETHSGEVGWRDPDQARWYLDRIGNLAPRIAGEHAIVEVLPSEPERLLDLGCGDGRLIALALEARPSLSHAVALDRSPPMLEHARNRFSEDARVEVREHDLADTLEVVGDFDVVTSGFAIHHLTDDRKKTLFAEVVQQLSPGGVFANLDVVLSATPELHRTFLAAIGRTADDPEDRLVDIETQLAWMREAGLEQVDCIWRWRGFALLVGQVR